MLEFIPLLKYDGYYKGLMGLFQQPHCPRFSRVWPVLAVYSAAALSAFFFQQYAVQLSQTIPGAVVNVKSIGMFYLPIVVLIETLTSRERHSPMTLAAGISAIVLSILLVRSLV